MIFKEPAKLLYFTNALTSLKKQIRKKLHGFKQGYTPFYVERRQTHSLVL
jgi:hypothetical protein